MNQIENMIEELRTYVASCTYSTDEIIAELVAIQNAMHALNTNKKYLN